jgi:hypothetical protein
LISEKQDRRSLLKALLVFRAFLAAPVALAARVLSAAGPTTTAPARAAAVQPSLEEIARQCLDAYWNRGDASLFRMHGLDTKTLQADTFLAKHIKTVREPGKGGDLYRQAFPDLKFDLLGTSRVGNVVTVRFNAQGTHRGHLGDLKTTGRRASVAGRWNVTFVDGKVSTFNCAWDQAGLERQMS